MTDAAFFDLDNTLVRGSALFHLGSALLRRFGVPWNDITRLGWHHLGYRIRGERAGEVEDMRERALSLAAGLRVAEIVWLSEELYDKRLGPRLVGGTCRLATEHLDNGDAVWLVTAAPQELAELVARRLGLTGALGTVAEVHDGAWTGRLAGEVLHGPTKASAVSALAQATGIDLGASYAYSDSINDLPLLEAVAHPCAVNPDHRLRRVAIERSWPVQEFRSARRALSWTIRSPRPGRPSPPLAA